MQYSLSSVIFFFFLFLNILKRVFLFFIVKPEFGMTGIKKTAKKNLLFSYKYAEKISSQYRARTYIILGIGNLLCIHQIISRVFGRIISTVSPTTVNHWTENIYQQNSRQAPRPIQLTYVSESVSTMQTEHERFRNGTQKSGGESKIRQIRHFLTSNPIILYVYYYCTLITLNYKKKQ